MKKRFFGFKLLQITALIGATFLLAGVTRAAEGDVADPNQSTTTIETSGEAEIVVENNSSQSSEEGASTSQENNSTPPPAEEGATESSYNTANTTPAEPASGAESVYTAAPADVERSQTPLPTARKQFQNNYDLTHSTEAETQALEAVPMSPGMGFPGSLPSPELPDGPGLFLAALQGMRYFPLPSSSSLLALPSWNVPQVPWSPLHIQYALIVVVAASFIVFIHASGFRGAGRSDVPTASNPVFLFCYSTLVNCLGIISPSSSPFLMGSETKRLTNTTL